MKRLLPLLVLLLLFLVGCVDDDPGYYFDPNGTLHVWGEYPQPIELALTTK